MSPGPAAWPPPPGRAPVRVWAVVPVFDEAATIATVVAGVRRVCPVIVVDDGSADGTGLQALGAGADCVLRHPRRAGKGAALRSGFAEAARRGATRVATLDGDGQHDPADLARLVEVARRAPEALVLGDRLGPAAGDRMPLLRRGAVWLADSALRRLTGLPLRDTQCGLRVYPAALLGRLPAPAEGFVLETAAVVAAAASGVPIRSVPVRRIYLPGRHSRFRALGDGVRIGWYLLRAMSGRLPAGRPPAPGPLSAAAAGLRGDLEMGGTG